jgi:hypothetical protein
MSRAPIKSESRGETFLAAESITARSEAHGSENKRSKSCYIASRAIRHCVEARRPDLNNLKLSSNSNRTRPPRQKTCQKLKVCLAHPLALSTPRSTHKTLLVPEMQPDHPSKNRYFSGRSLLQRSLKARGGRVTLFVGSTLFFVLVFRLQQMPIADSLATSQGKYCKWALAAEPSIRGGTKFEKPPGFGGRNGSRGVEQQQTCRTPAKPGPWGAFQEMAIAEPCKFIFWVLKLPRTPNKFKQDLQWRRCCSKLHASAAQPR